MFLSMLFLPLLTSLSVGMFGRKIGIKGTNILVLTCLGICTFEAFLISWEVIFSSCPISLELCTWIDTGTTSISWGFTMDPLNAWLISTVLGISFLVHIFASDYMADDPNPQKFMALLLAFTGFMVLLIAGDNLAVLFLGWEGIGITSYLLIGYWFDRALASNAAAQAIIVNRIGDTFFTIALFILIGVWGSGSLDLHELNYTFSSFSVPSTWIVTWTGILLVLAAAGKSAQFLLHTWLPNAMEGPTPVSSLLHAATLVMGGIYLLLRTTSILNASDYALITAAFLGITTAFFAASTALLQNDIKRVIAYSTCSQFGYLFASTGLSQTSSTVLHLSSHAGFKALLFICAGGIIHSMKDQQDFRRLGGLITLLPFTYAAMLTASFSLMALPYLSGNVSKDLILELTSVYISIPGTFMWQLGSLIAGITACYSVRLLALTFFGEATASKTSYENIHEQPKGLVIPMITLSLVSIFFGYLAKEPLSGMGTDSVIHYWTMQYSTNLPEAEFGLSLLNKDFPVIATLIGTLTGTVLFIFSVPVKVENPYATLILNSLSSKWFVDGFFAKIFSWPILRLGIFASKVVDRGMFELFGVQGILIQVKQISNFSSRDIALEKVYTNIPEYALYVGIIALTFSFYTVAPVLDISIIFIFFLAFFLA